MRPYKNNNMKKGTAIFLIISSIALALIAGVCLTELKRMAYQPKYTIVRDTVLIDPSTRNTSAWDEYEIKFTSDSIYVYDAQELIKILNAKECGKLHSVLMAENN
jgi:hypothetical protein